MSLALFFQLRREKMQLLMTWSIKKFIILHYRSSSQSSRAGRFRNLVTFSKVSACFANISMWAHPPSGSTFVWLNIWKQANKHHLLFGDGIELVEKNNIQWFRWDLKNWGAVPQHFSCRRLTNQRCSPGANQRLCSTGAGVNVWQRKWKTSIDRAQLSSPPWMDCYCSEGSRGNQTGSSGSQWRL